MRGEKVDERGEVVIAVGEYSDVVRVMFLFFGDREIELLRCSGEDKVVARAEEGRWRREVACSEAEVKRWRWKQQRVHYFLT